MADEPEEPVEPLEDDEPVESAEGRLASADEAEITALAELALCENLAQTSGWAARWSATMAGADATLLWAPDTVHPIFLCIGAEGEGVEKVLRRSAPRDTGYVHELVRDRQPIVLTGDELTADDPFVRGCHRAPRVSRGAAAGRGPDRGPARDLLHRDPERRGSARAGWSTSSSRRRRPSDGRCAPSARPSGCSTRSSG